MLPVGPWERNIYFKPPAFSDNLHPLSSSFLSPLIVLHWLSACGNSVGVQLNCLGSKFGFKWRNPSNLHVWPLRSLKRPIPQCLIKEMPQCVSTWLLPRWWECRCLCGWYSLSLSDCQRRPSSSEHSPCLNGSGTHPRLRLGSAQATPLPFQGALQIGPLSLWGSSGGVTDGGCSVSPKFEFPCFPWLMLSS